MSVTFRSYELYAVHSKYCVFHHQTTLKSLNCVLLERWAKWSTESRLTTRFDHRRLQTSSDCPSPAADQRFCHRHRHPSSSCVPGPPTQSPYINVLFDNWFISAAVTVETVVLLSRCRSWDRRPSRPNLNEETIHLRRRWSARCFGDVEPRHLRRRRLLCRSIIMSLAVNNDPTLYDIVHYVGPSSSNAYVPSLHVACARSSSRDVNL